MTKHLMSNEPAQVSVIWKWYVDSKASLDETRQSITNKIKKGKTLPSVFAFKTPNEVKQQFERDAKELDYAAMLGLISALEAAFRIDHGDRLTSNKNDIISTKFFEHAKGKHKTRTLFGDNILSTWIKNTTSQDLKATIQTLMNIIPLRDWLAHGRCWPKSFQQPFNPDTILIIAKSLRKYLPSDFKGHKYLII